MQVIEPRSISKALDLHPFAGWLVEGPIRHCHREALSREYPLSGFTTTRGDEHDERAGYLGGRLEIRLIGPGLSPGAAALSPLWEQYLVELRSEEYRAMMSARTGVDLAGAVTRLRFSRYPPGSFIGRHYDGQHDKLLTQVLYFNLDWGADWGGDFVMLGETPESGFERSIPPSIDHSIVNLSTPQASHEVRRVADHAGEMRHTLLVEWYRGVARKSDGSAQLAA